MNETTGDASTATTDPDPDVAAEAADSDPAGSTDGDEQAAEAGAEAEPESDEPLAAAGCDWLRELFVGMNLEVDVEAIEEDDRIHFNVSGRDADWLLGAGKLGPKAIEGVETILQCTYSEHDDDRELYVDVDGAREERKQTLQQVADRMADRALDMGEPFTVSGLNSTERRIIHRQLRDNDAVDTESIGEGIFRRLRILPENH